MTVAQIDVAKGRYSFRFEDQLISALDEMTSDRESPYYRWTRTGLVEHALEETYGKLIKVYVREIKKPEDSTE